MKPTVFGVLAFLPPPPQPRLRADRTRSKFSGASCLKSMTGGVGGGGADQVFNITPPDAQ